jgi:16S rRNA (cytidine1402-2'-O)-methyltransferase
MAGNLYIVSTPIGNLEDITIRAKNILCNIKIILAEDTRHSKILLNNIGAIPERLISFHDYNKERTTPYIISLLKENKDIALICDAGTPGIADEAFYIVREAINNNINVVPVPGPSSLLAALVCSGLPTDRFVFENFLPSKTSKRQSFFLSCKNEHRTVIFYESPFRIIKVLTEMKTIFGEISCVIARELTKVHEEFIRGTPATLLEHFKKNPPRGEMVVIFNTRVKPYNVLYN